MSADTLTAGYPVHRVVSYWPWTNPHGAQFTDYTAACGLTDTLVGRNSFGRAGTARRKELCSRCFPNQNMSGYFPKPTLESPAARAQRRPPPRQRPPHPVAFPRVAPPVRGRQVPRVQRVATLGQPHNVVGGASHAVAGRDPGQLIVDGPTTQAAREALGFTVGHAGGLGAAPPGAVAARAVTDHTAPPDCA